MQPRLFTQKINQLKNTQEVSEFEKLYFRIKTFSSTSYELAKLKSLEVATSVATSLISVLSVTVMVVLFTIFFNIGMALWLGDLLGKVYYGFFIVAIFYLVVGVILYFFLRKWIKGPVSKLIITEALR
jgi:ABC-type multidrug transport system fused ATPase/permease subunit